MFKITEHYVYTVMKDIIIFKMIALWHTRFYQTDSDKRSSSSGVNI
jgi:hypothetical protein